jgi:hypothetical protein
MIASFIDGRVRIRARALTGPETLRSLVRMIEVRPGVRRISANARTGSLLLEYDPDILSREDLLAAVNVLDAICGGQEDRAPAGARGLLNRRTELRALGLSAGLCAGGILVSKRLHAGAGLVFLLLAVRHVFQYRGQLFYSNSR